MAVSNVISCENTVKYIEDDSEDVLEVNRTEDVDYYTNQSNHPPHPVLSYHRTYSAQRGQPIKQQPNPFPNREPTFAELVFKVLKSIKENTQSYAILIKLYTQ